MKKQNLLRIATLFSTLALPSMALAAPWNIDTSHSSVGFKIRHMMVSNVKGDFRSFNGTVDIDDKDPSKISANVTIDVASIDTNMAKRDEHLRGANFFDVARYPTMKFVSTNVIKTGEGKLRMEGALTMHGITKPVVLDVEGPTRSYKDPWGNPKRGVTATTRISRKEFGLTWNKAIENGGVMVSDDVDITLELELNGK